MADEERSSLLRDPDGRVNRTYVTDYLQFLGHPFARAQYDDLVRLVKAHVARVPYEVVSKFVYAGTDRKLHALIPNLDTFVSNLQTRGFGGNCYILAINFCRLLQAVGFDAHLVRVCPGHIGMVVYLQEMVDGPYYVDVGYGSPLDRPVPLRTMGLQSWKMERFGELIRFIRLSGDSIEFDRVCKGQSFVKKEIHLAPVGEDDFVDDIRASWLDEDNNRFMRRISMARVMPDAYVWLRDATLTTRTEGAETVETFDDVDKWMKRIACVFGLRSDDIGFAYRFLRERGVDLGFPG